MQLRCSKFVRPGAKRIISASITSKLLTMAFINKDGKLAIIVMNPTDSKIKYHVWEPLPCKNFAYKFQGIGQAAAPIFPAVSPRTRDKFMWNVPLGH